MKPIRALLAFAACASLDCGPGAGPLGPTTLRPSSTSLRPAPSPNQAISLCASISDDGTVARGPALLPQGRGGLLQLRGHGLPGPQLLRHRARPPRGQDQDPRVLRAGHRRPVPAPAHEHLPDGGAARGRVRVPARGEGREEGGAASASSPRTRSRAASSPTTSWPPASLLSPSRSSDGGGAFPSPAPASPGPRLRGRPRPPSARFEVTGPHQQPRRRDPRGRGLPEERGRRDGLCPWTSRASSLEERGACASIGAWPRARATTWCCSSPSRCRGRASTR